MVYVRQNIAFEDLSTFGERLRYEREQQNLSRPALADMTDGALSARAISHLETGSTDATAQRIELLSNLLSVDRDWLGFGDRSNLPATGDYSGNDNDDRGSDLNSPTREPDEPENMPGGAENTGFDRSNRSEKPVGTSLTGLTGSIDKTGSDQDQTPKSIPVRMYIDEMIGILAHIDTLREDGLQKHPRKMPKLLDQAREIGSCLEASDLEELALERGLDPEQINTESLSEELFEEFILRLIDTALLGIDLYTLDEDTLKTFARKHDVPRPFFGWDGASELISSVRERYWHEALEGGIRLTISIRQSA